MTQRVERWIPTLIQSRIACCRRKSCMNLNVSRAHHNGRFFHSITFFQAQWKAENLLYRGQRRRSKIGSNLTLNLQLEKLEYSRFNAPEGLAEVSQRFGEEVKALLASNRHAERWITSSPRFNDRIRNVRAGRLRSTRQIYTPPVSEFAPWVSCIRRGVF